MEKLVMPQHLQSFYAGKKVFVTGHTGFKGSWLCACLHALGAKVKGYALPPAYANGLFDKLQPLNIVDSAIADIRDKERLSVEVAQFSPELIFHLAAQPLVRYSYRAPAETFNINVTGTANLLEAASAVQNACSIVVITTDKVYENKEQDILYKEDDMLGGYDPYSASKACAEIVVSAFRNSFFHPSAYSSHHKALASARAGNVIGGGDWSEDRIIPDIVRSLQAGKEINVRNPFAIRPWQHVLEPVFAYLKLGAALHQRPQHFSKAYNFGPLPADHLKVGKLVETAIATWGGGQWKDVSDPAALHEAGILKLSIERAGKELQWRPKLSAAEAVRWTIDWYRAPEEDKAAVTFAQIKSYADYEV